MKTTKLIMRSAYGNQYRKPVKGIKQPSRTKQAFKDECDINTILKRYQTQGILPDMIKKNPMYGDFSQGTDYQEALNLINVANQQFNALPSRVRAQFENNPQKFLEFATNPQNIDQMVELGLATKKSIETNVDENQPKQKAGTKPKTESKEKSEDIGNSV